MDQDQITCPGELIAWLGVSLALFFLFDARYIGHLLLHHLEAPVQRATGWDTPYPHSLEWAYFPGPVRLRLAIARAMED